MLGFTWMEVSTGIFLCDSKNANEFCRGAIKEPVEKLADLPRCFYENAYR